MPSLPFAVVSNRDFSARKMNPDFKLRPASWVRNAIGGMKSATIEIDSPASIAWEATALLRCPIAIYNGYSSAVWWGYAHEVEVDLPGVTVGVTLDDLANEIRVGYTTVGTDAVPSASAQTDWARDASSIGAFGVRQLTYSISDASATEATSRRDWLLDTKKNAQALVRDVRKNSKSGGRLYCRGWWSTLDWYYAQISGPAADLSFENPPDNGASIGYSAGIAKVMQTFTTGDDDLALSQVILFLRKVGAPADNVVVNIYAVDANGDPTGASLSTGLTAASALAVGSGATDAFAWITISMGAYTLVKKTQYAMVLTRSGANSSTDFAQVGVKFSGGYAGGLFKIWNGSAWTQAGYESATPDWTMNFKLSAGSGLIDTNKLLYSFITQYGQFFKSVSVETASGITKSPLSSGEQRALSPIEALLAAGVTGSRRYCAEVSIDRRVRIYEEPDIPNISTVPYLLSSNGNITNNLRSVLDPGVLPIGYCMIKDLAGMTLGQSLVSSADTFFIDESEWTEGQGLRVTPRGLPDPFKIGGRE